MDPELLRTLFVRDDDDDGPAPPCDADNDYDGRMGVRISSVFVILVGSMAGAVFPIIASRMGANTRYLSWAFFIAKYFGSGVIVATAFIHLLAPANEALTNRCLTGPISKYSWPEAIALMTIVVLFFVELLVMRFAHFGGDHDDNDAESHGHQHLDVTGVATEEGVDEAKNHIPGENHLGHSSEHHTVQVTDKGFEMSLEEYTAQLTSIFVLEFGIIFHSVFIGLTLAVSGDEFTTLYIVLVFHQTFEGLGLGSRLATAPWPKSKKSTPYLMGIAYGLATPIAIAIGLGVRKSYPPEGRTTLIVNGVFDSISAGILIYTALVELMAHEFMFSPSMRKAPFRIVLAAYVLLCLGVALMALLGYWA